jgi:glycosyltransferase involved in cell wall biosynthesis
MSDRHTRIVHLYALGLSDLGGVASSFRAWVEGLAKAGAEVVAVTAGGTPPTDSVARWVNISFRGRGALSVPVGLDKVLRKGDVLVLHSAWSTTNVAAARIARRVGARYITVPHGGYDPRVVDRRRSIKRVWAATLERPMLRRAAAVHIFFEAEKEHLRKLGYTGTTIVAPNGIAPPPVDGGDPDGYLLWWGRLDVEHKGIDLLIDAMKRVAKPLLMHGVGSADERVRVSALIQKAGVDDHVSLLPPVSGSKKWDVLAGASAFVFPSRWDSHSIAVMEAAAAGIPVVASDSTFVGRELASAGAAIAVRPDEASLATGIKRALSSDGKRVATAGRELALQHYSPEAVARSFLEQLRAVV